MIEIPLDVCGHYSSLEDFRKYKEEKREKVACEAFSERNKVIKDVCLFFLKPTLSIYRKPSRFRLELYGIKIMETTNGISYA